MPWGVMLAALIMRLYIAQDHDHDQNHHQGYGGVGHDLDQGEELAHLKRIVLNCDIRAILSFCNVLT